ncbi:MAG: large subunit ribosomal protein L31 [Polyangiales bacterium]|jgi:large subunit ribosomal protein L31
MKPDIHPVCHPVVFVDAEFEVISKSTMKSRETREIDGVEHYVIKVDISAFSHPFYTGKEKVMDTEGRVERFKKRYGKKKAAAPGEEGEAAAPAEAAEAAPAADSAE